MGDSEYYRFIGRRLTAGTFVIYKDMQEQLIATLIGYWKLSLGFLCVALLFVVSVKFLNSYVRKLKLRNLHYSYFYSILLYAIFVACFFLGIRSTFDSRPLSPGHAFIGRTYKEGNLILNSTYTLLRSISSSYIQPYKFYSNNKDFIPYLEKLTLSPIIKNKNNKNVVLFIMESFYLAYMGYPNSYKGYTPFLNELASKSIFFTNHYSNGVNTLSASLPLLCGLPNLMPGPNFIRSTFRTNKMLGIGDVLRKHGYDTSYFHGGRNGTMYLSVAAGISGIEKYYGLNEYPNRAHHDGHWGVPDDLFFDFFADTLSTHKEPFFSTIFSLSSHHPFKIPHKFKGRFPKGTVGYHESIGYADFALRSFFEKVSKEPWYKNTLFVITADHTAATDQESYGDILGSFKVPLIVFDPSGELKPKVVKHATQHVDLPVTLYSYLGIPPDNVLLFGQNILRDDFQGRAINITQDDSFLLVHDKHYMTFNPKLNQSHLYKYQSLEPKKTILADDNTELKDSLLREMKAFIQYYTNGLINNDILYPFPKKFGIVNKK